MTTKFAAFFEFFFLNSARTSKFLLVAFGVSSIFIASTPLAICAAFFSPFVFEGPLLPLPAAAA
jgi:hypothetical protein